MTGAEVANPGRSGVFKDDVIGKKELGRTRTGKKYHTIQWLTKVLEKRRAVWFIHSGHISLTSLAA